MRAAFEKYGTPTPTGFGEYLYLRNGAFVADTVTVTATGILGEDGFDPSQPGLYLSAARLLAALDVAEYTAAFVDANPREQSWPMKSALAAYRSTR